MSSTAIAQAPSPATSTYAPKQIAERYGVGEHKVLAWIAAGDLQAVNVGTRRNGGKPRWRITQESLDAFERARSSRPAPEPTRRARKVKRPAATQFFK